MSEQWHVAVCKSSWQNQLRPKCLKTSLITHLCYYITGCRGEWCRSDIQMIILMIDRGKYGEMELGDHKIGQEISLCNIQYWLRERVSITPEENMTHLWIIYSYVFIYWKLVAIWVCFFSSVWVCVRYRGWRLTQCHRSMLCPQSVFWGPVLILLRFLGLLWTVIHYLVRWIVQYNVKKRNVHVRVEPWEASGEHTWL